MTRTRTHRDLRTTRGFTLIEMVVVVIIIAVLATAIGPTLWHKIAESKTSVTKNNAAAIVSAINLYMGDYGSLPDPSDLTVLCKKAGDGKTPPLENCDMLKDAWGRQFKLIVPGQKNNTFDVVSYGADGKPGGTGEDEDIIKP